MDEDSEKVQEGAGENSTLYYGIGAAVLILLVIGIYFLRPKSSTTTSQLSQAGATGASMVRPTDPIKGLACEIQYYNPVVGFNQYYLSAEGVDLTNTKSLNCDFTVSSGGTEKTKSTGRTALLNDDVNRGGKNFRCTTDAVEVTPDVETVIDVVVTNDRKESATCSAAFFFPAP